LPDDQANKTIDKFQQITANTEAAAAASRDYAKSFVELEASFDKFLSAAEIKLLPTLSKLTKELSLFLSADQNSIFNKALSESTFAKLLGLKPDDFFDSKSNSSIYKSTKSSEPHIVGESYKSASESAFESPDIVAQRKLAHGGVDPYLDYMAKGKNSLSVADTTPFGTGAINNTSTQNSKQYNIKTGDIHVNTNTDNPRAVGSAIANELEIHFRTAAANLDDGVAY